MKDAKLIEKDYFNRLEQVLDDSWKVFKSQFINDRNEINKEAPFQQHFAQIITSVGNLYSLNKDDLFKMDLETKCKDVKGKSKYIDITCGFWEKVNCAIELKFKTNKQGAQDIGRIDAYIDIEALEDVVIKKGIFDFGKFYMITDSAIYIKLATRGDAIDFQTYDEYRTENKDFIHNPNWKNAKLIKVNLKNSYTFHWEKAKKGDKDWYFLELTVKKDIK